MQGDDAGRKRDIAIALWYILFLYSTLSVMPMFWRRISRFSDNVADILPAAILIILGILAVILLIHNRKPVTSFVWLMVLVAGYVTGMQMIKLAVEKIHFVEYSVLAIFVFRVLRHYVLGKMIYFWSALAVFFLGFIDELIQKALPNRVYDVGDIVVNTIAGFLGLALIAFCFQPKLKVAP